jgi:hypothetical protein
MLPGTLLWEVRLTTACVLPVALVPVYAIPIPLNEMDTPVVSCTNVISEPVGVHLLQIPFLKLLDDLFEEPGSYRTCG